MSAVLTERRDRVMLITLNRPDKRNAVDRPTADALRAAGADAIAEWVRRGGHLVIVVPADGGGWTSPGGALAPLLPDVEFVRREGVDLGAYRPLLTSSETAPLPDGAILHELRVRDASDATPILVGPGGAPVVVRVSEEEPKLGDLPWMLLGVHSARLDLANRDLVLDEALGLNCAWYADILTTLTER